MGSAPSGELGVWLSGTIICFPADQLFWWQNIASSLSDFIPDVTGKPCEGIFILYPLLFLGV
jgi:hypothetical protein